MTDDIREYLRAAQAAEVRGDRAQAVELLLKIATMYRGEGNTARALQMLRHAKRLDGDREDIDEAVRRLEWIPDASIQRSAGDDEEERKALAPLQAFQDAAEEKRLIERGPTRAEPALAAWCSFCCRPKKEVGDLVAGPAGSFICAACIRESAELLELVPERVGAPNLAPSPAATLATPFDSIECVGQQQARQGVEAGLRSGARWILLLGPAGSGKTIFIRDLEHRGFGRRVSSSGELLGALPEHRLLVDAAEALSAESLRRLVEWSDPPGHQIVLTLRGNAPEARIALHNGEQEHRVWTSQELVEASGGTLSHELAERIEVVALFESHSEEQLLALAQRWVAGREAILGAELLGVLVAEAARSGRGGHELRALLSRTPPGSWSLKSVAPDRKPRRRSKREP